MAPERAIPPPSFSEDQLREYFKHIKLPEKYYSAGCRRDEAFLTALHRYHIAAIPYENLSLHYSSHKTISLDPTFLFAKFVTNGRNRGGYCMEGSLFFLEILRSIGFRAYPAMVRIRLRENGVPKGDYIGIVHLVIIIEVPTAHGETEKYVCDVAFGGDGPVVPMPFKEGVVTRNIGTQEIRFVHEELPKSLGKYWVYQYRNGPDKEWNSFYAFNDTEALARDFEPINYWTSQGPTFQKTTMIIVKFLLGPAGPDGDSGVVGKIMLVNDTIKRNMGGKTEVVQVCSTEPERVEALKKHFGISLTDEEIIGIQGSVTELKDVEVLGA
ncbi:hypothetical protein M406DRAFT_94316 [Cryphonectria parasitica EP155]|uniref:Arylamine N-acetyltransferase n=1 Tax=Cryphonectria parasitica (strain ATCC 38755 / EP155) TaxID=660469 RepID=A0A9P4XYM4_CRYP1|nr:uncharacterized protein M406DRAFT_94316 [Cryphonectria parasitica EP155]KAF3763313.1 hypothetical protein M406DRAFT_94316 [Cryphonectria parasitica EP155]